MEIPKVQEKNYKSVDEDELEDLIFKEIEEINRYSVANQLRSGFFGRDASVQTNVSELPLVKQLSNGTAELVKAMDTLKKETASRIDALQAQFESRLQREAEAFFSRINYRVKAIETHHKEVGCAHRCSLNKVNILRNSFQQQLADAIAVIKASYKTYYMKKGAVLEVVPADTGREQEHLDEIQEKDFQIERLKEQLSEYEERENRARPADDPEKSWLKAENARLRRDADALRQDLANRDQKLKDLVLDHSRMRLKAEDEHKALQKMLNDKEELHVLSNMENESTRQTMIRLKQELEKQIGALENSRQSEAAEICGFAANQRTADETKHEAEQEELLIGRESTSHPAKELTEELERLRKADASQKELIDRLQTQIIRNNHTWERKFEILKKSFHAIKDEMFLRHSLRRQAAMLHQASLSYTVDVPIVCQGQTQKKGSKGNASFKNTLVSCKGAGAPQGAGHAHETGDLRLLTGRRTDVFAYAGCRLAGVDVDSDEELGDVLSFPPPPNSQDSSYSSPQVPDSVPTYDPHRE
ncbi:uncharacterized protein C10orf67 homolog, mitochondrial isoform X2 [Trichomycterus rosablanca]|uniref:uncharacterized protein C10orf67 homolog, mitochondrial isoform X2 n=1 Tax=Trichomycterus rosablanca TaxID=2290929 RepID=UPI002F35885C